MAGRYLGIGSRERMTRLIISLQLFIVLLQRGRRVVKLERLVGMDGLEPSTSSLSVTRSNRLSYMPTKRLRFKGL